MLGSQPASTGLSSLGSQPREIVLNAVTLMTADVLSLLRQQNKADGVHDGSTSAVNADDSTSVSADHFGVR